MCLICIEFEKNKLKVNEAWRNLQEMKSGMTDEHYDEVVAMLLETLEDEQEIEDKEELDLLLERLEHEGQLTFGYASDIPSQDRDADDQDPDGYSGYETWSLGNDIY